MSNTLSKLGKLIKEKPIPEKVSQKVISHSQYTVYKTCPYQWYLRYIEKIKPFSSTIHTIFGTAMHETLQNYLTVMYKLTAKKADEIDLEEYLADRFIAAYTEEKKKNEDKDFSTEDEFNDFYEDGKLILKWFRTNRRKFFSIKGVELLGIEVPLMQPTDANPNVYFTGYLDIVLYDADLKQIIIIDFKTSTRGWKDQYEKKDEKKIDQILWYKSYFAKQYEVPVESIDVQFMILKRKLYENAEFPQPRIQIFRPAHGVMKMKKAAYNMSKFVTECFTQEGNYNLERTYLKTPSEHNCKFCPFNEDLQMCDKRN